MNNKPQILTLNLKSSAIKLLKKASFNIYEGSLGEIINTKNEENQLKYCLSNHDFPENIHEYDIVIVDLGYTQVVEYKLENNTRVKNKTDSNTFFLCRYPRTLFDPRGYASRILFYDLKKMMKHDSILIVFQSKNEKIKYNFVEKNGHSLKYLKEEESSLYEFLSVFPFLENKVGKETKVSINHKFLTSFLNKYNSDFTYEIVFDHPKVWLEDNRENAPSFFPLVLNRDDEIVSYLSIEDKSLVFLLPKIQDYSVFLREFLQEIVPSLAPNVFPFSTENLWTKDLNYYLPNNEKLINEKSLLLEDWKNKNKSKDDEIVDNYEKYKFLHDILTETGDELVKATIKFLDWLGFSDIKDMDEVDATTLEEDIQIKIPEGLFVIEIKGIGGTSKDSECSQVSKIKYRRAKERDQFDVFGLYIVNHQRHLPPLNRKNPPFTPEQISDAENDERGLVTTFQLFNLYFEIEKEIITKSEARECLLQYGHIRFTPSNLVFIDTVKEVFQKGKISIINIKNAKVSVGDLLFVESKDKYHVAKVIEMHVDDKPAQSAIDVEVGIKTDIVIDIESKIWMKS